MWLFYVCKMRSLYITQTGLKLLTLLPLLLLLSFECWDHKCEVPHWVSWCLCVCVFLSSAQPPVLVFVRVHLDFTRVLVLECTWLLHGCLGSILRFSYLFVTMLGIWTWVQHLCDRHFTNGAISLAPSYQCWSICGWHLPDFLISQWMY